MSGLGVLIVDHGNSGLGFGLSVSCAASPIDLSQIYSKADFRGTAPAVAKSSLPAGMSSISLLRYERPDNRVRERSVAVGGRGQFGPLLFLFCSSQAKKAHQNRFAH